MRRARANSTATFMTFAGTGGKPPAQARRCRGDGHFEYAAGATNMALDLTTLYAFICGRGAQEKTRAELKGEFALDVVPSRHYGANRPSMRRSITDWPPDVFADWG